MIGLVVACRQQVVQVREREVVVVSGVIGIGIEIESESVHY